MSVKTQFGSVGYNGNNFLLDSFSVIGADTRNGFDLETANRLVSMNAYVGAHPEKVDAAGFNGYVAKLSSYTMTESVQPIVSSTRNKPGSGMK
ncbi:MAG: hypothetical protein ACAH80_04750 [Alphaproteobacteria bacterium]